MPIREQLSCILQNSFNKLSKAERILLEAHIFVRISEEFHEMFRKQNTTYVKLLKGDQMEEDTVTEMNLLKILVNDIVSTNEYTLEGIANFVRMPIDVLLEIVSGINTNPSLMLATRIIKLHGDVRRDLYNKLIKKILEEIAA